MLLCHIYMVYPDPIPPAIAIRAPDEHVTEELHFDLFEAGPAATFTLTDGGVEAECAGVQASLASLFGLGKHLTDVVERADIDGGI